jgi:hypothetical protein
LKYHAVLDQKTALYGTSCSAVLHGNSCLIDAGSSGTRQVEIANANGTPEPLTGRFVRARLYRAAVQNEEETA